MKSTALLIVAAAASIAAPEVAPNLVTGAPGPIDQQWEYLHATTRFIGVPIDILTAAVIGAIAAVAVRSLGTWKEVMATLIANVLLSTCAVAIVPDFMGWSWPSQGVQAATTVFLAFTAQAWGQEVLDRIGLLVGPILDRLLPRKEDNEQ